MRVAGIRSGGALGKIRDPNYWDDPPKPSRFPSATQKHYLSKSFEDASDCAQQSVMSRGMNGKWLATKQ
ncbi:hypothetical protein ALC56_06830 [Trachymyrmex septentrionalis]|uniref:Uncharacterized protein n=1 Tax=Trachymyrmex septentrionalis TaxID=34720 RepID=A0A195FEM6_9HYME|nr:hypothetical protein ALC56_06830 [Trachymyrmex septentrionalis]